MIKVFDIFLVFLAIYIFSWGIIKHFRLWRIGKEDKRSDKIGTRIKSFLVEGIAHRKILQDFYPGSLHLCIFLGFLIPIGVIFIAQFMFTLPVLIARLLSLALDIIAVFAIASLLLTLYRRYVTRPSRLDNKPEDFKALALILLIFLTGVFLESLRLSVVARDIQTWAPVGKALAALINTAGWSAGTKSLLAMIVFRIHFFLVLFTIAYIPFSTLFHIISSPMNMIFRSLDPKGMLSFMDLEDEEAESFGISKIEEFTWKHLMDLDACTRCGRCQEFCPAHITEAAISKKDHFRFKRPPSLTGPPDS